MTVSSTANRNDYTGNDTTATYNYSFRIFLNSDLKLTVRNTSTDVETELTLTTDYTVTGVGDASGGTIVLVDAGQDWISASSYLDTGYELTIRRVVPLTQGTDIRNQGDFYPEVHEDVFDKLTMTDQQQQDEIDRSIKLPETLDPATFDAALPTPTANYFLRFNSAGDGLTQSAGTAANLTDSDISASADITRTKLAPGTADYVLINDAVGEFSEEQYLDKSRGGAGADMSSVTFPSTGTITTDAGTSTFTNKTFDADGTGNSLTNVEDANIKAGAAIDAAKIHDASVSNTEFGYLNGVTSAIQTQIDSKLPTTITTTGDIIYSSSGSTSARLPAGSAGEVLTMSGGVPAWATNSVSPIAPSSKTTTYTATTSDQTILADTSGGAWTLTLYTASGNAGRELYVTKTTSDLSALTIDGNAAETINGFTSVKLITFGESLRIVSDGSNWIITQYIPSTAWTSFTFTLGAVTTAPTVSADVGEAYLRRNGKNMDFFVNFQLASSGNSGGSGNYLATIPNSEAIDTSLLTINSSSATEYSPVFGFGNSFDGSSNRSALQLIPYSSTQFFFWDIRPDSQGTWSNTRTAISNNGCFSFKVTDIPISGWDI